MVGKAERGRENARGIKCYHLHVLLGKVTLRKGAVVLFKDKSDERF